MQRHKEGALTQDELNTLATAFAEAALKLDGAVKTAA